VGPLGAAEQWGGNRTSHAGDIDNMNNSQRVNNSIKYTSQNWGGFKFGGLYSFGGVAGSTGQNRIYSFGANFNSGALSLAAAYLNVRNPNVSFAGNNANGGGVGVNNYGTANPIYGGYASASTYQVASAGGAYVIGSATVGFTYSNVQFRGLGATSHSGPNPNGYFGNAIFNSVEANLKYQVTPALLVGASYTYTHGSGADTNKAGVQKGDANYHQVSLGIDYYLSRRTDVYLIGTYQMASGVDSAGTASTAEVGSVGGSATGRQALARLGLRQRF
jgi:predicted porin